MALNISYKGIALGGITGFLGGLALTALAQVSGVVAVAPGIPVAAFVPIFTFLAAIVGAFEEV